MAHFTATFHTTKPMQAEFKNGGDFSAVFAIPKSYQGKYEFTPTKSTQIIETAGTTLGGNITIKPIPSNYGQIEWNGAFLRIF